MDCMSQRFWNGLTAATLAATLTAVSSTSRAEQTQSLAQQDQPDVLAAEIAHSSRQPKVQEKLGTSSPAAATSESQSVETVKVGEYQSQASNRRRSEVVAKVHSHQKAGRQAVTLYVRNIPVLTFLGTQSDSSSDTKVGTTEQSDAIALDAQNKAISESARFSDAGARLDQAKSLSPTEMAKANQASKDDPLAEATALAAKLNQLYRNDLDAKSIKVSWKSSPDASGARRERYVIEAGEDELVEMNSRIILPDTTRNLAKDALQATNRLRRLLGKAAPLRQIEGLPPGRSHNVIAAASGVLRRAGNGMASWYGPGFNGRRSASGEIFNQNALTAAHKTLPFGTKVQVTNMNNGRTVVVRINDRGPYAHGRVIDVSAAAARVLGMMGSGVAPVRLDIVGASGSASVGR